MRLPRASGILLHPTSLPGDFGIGDLGPKATDFVDFLSDAKQSYWQILPLGPTGYGDSPYQSFSAFAGNTLLISVELLADEGLLSRQELSSVPSFDKKRVDFGSVAEWKTRLLAQAYLNFRTAQNSLTKEFRGFCEKQNFWLDDYALFRAIRAANGQQPWQEWPQDLKSRDSAAIDKAAGQLSEAVDAEKFAQFLFFRQWAALKKYANALGIKIIGDTPIFVALDSSDVWCNQDKFKLNADGTASSVSGVPPDYFSKTGQLWGNPIYDWEALKKDGFHWWVARIHSMLQLVDIVRLDHFRGFAASWEVPGKDKTAENGKWVGVPGRDLFETLKRDLREIPLIAEDLGDITPDVIELRDEFGFPGMRVLQFAFGGDSTNQDLPHNYVNNCVAYTGTHDNDTVVGWFRSAKPDSPESSHCLKYLSSDGSEIQWDFIRAIWSSVADTAIAPMQDILGLGSDARMNLPGSTSGNWGWRLREGTISQGTTERLRDLTSLFGRERQ